MAELKRTNKYDDIIDLPHHQSKTRSHMSIMDRAAQFAPFSALTGLEEEMDETARQSEEHFLNDTLRIKAEEMP